MKMRIVLFSAFRFDDFFFILSQNSENAHYFKIYIKS